MAGIDDIIAGGAGASSRADFSAIGDLPKAYWEGRDQKAKNDLRDVFKGGLPMKEGQVDWPTVTQKFFEVGAVDQGISAAGQALAQQRMEYGQRSAAEAFPQNPAPIVTPPSASAPRLKEVAAPLNKGGVQAQGQDQPTVMKILAQHVPNDQLGAASASIMRQLADVAPGLSATDPIDINDPRISNVLRPAVAQIKRMGLGQVQPPQPGDGQPMTQASQGQAQAQAPVPQGQQPDFNQRFNAARPGQGSDPTLGGLVPAGRTPQQQIGLLSRQNASGNLSPEAAKVNQSHIEAIQKAIERPNELKMYDKAVEQGFKGTIQEWMDRTDDNTTQRDILTKSTIPLIDESRKKATSAIEDIDAIHRSREELDQPGGVITGVWANDKLKLAKIGNSIGIPNSDKITNTEAFSAAVGKRVAAMVKAFGSGTAISDGDRRFAEKMSGGGIELNETSMRRILDIGEQADRAIIGRHNEFTDKAVKSNEGLKPSRDTLIVPQPGQYKKPNTSAAAFSSARDAIAKGAPRDAVMKRLKENGHDPSGL